MRDSRRFLSLILWGCLLGMAGGDALARIPPSEMKPLIPLDYEPQDKDERGLWEICDRIERDLVASNFLVRDKQLNEYVTSVTRRLLGDRVADLRIYIVRNPEFNAAMFPNGMMVVHTGLLARVRNEAQLAAVLGHESGHYLRLHSLRSWRDMKTKTATMAVIAVAAAGASGATGQNWYDLANAINNGLFLSLFSFSRDMERGRRVRPAITPRSRLCAACGVRCLGAGARRTQSERGGAQKENRRQVTIHAVDASADDRAHVRDESLRDGNRGQGADEREVGSASR
jgi:hypothetical protein